MKESLYAVKIIARFTNRGIIHSYFSSVGDRAIILYRFSHYLSAHKLRLLAILVHNHAVKVTGADISPECSIGAGIRLGHSVGVVIGSNVILGQNVLIQSGVTIGARHQSLDDSSVRVGNCVQLGSGCKIIGNVEIGSNVQVGANAVVLHSVLAGETVVGVPAKTLASAKQTKSFIENATLQ